MSVCFLINCVLNFCNNSMDLCENEQDNAVTAIFELPGLTKEDVHVNVRNNWLTVSGESSDEDISTYSICERKHGKFMRTLQLPQGIKVIDHVF